MLMFIFKALITIFDIIMIFVFLYASGENPSKNSAIGSLFVELLFICNALMIWSRR